MNPPTIITERLHDLWTVWMEDHSEAGFGGDTPATAITRLLKTLPDLDAERIVADNEHTTADRLVFRIGQTCDECGGSGQYVGLAETSDCEACGGRGWR